MDGVILIDKEAGYTSFDVVSLVRKSLGIKKVGHCGTLDPNATGLLIVLVGKATKCAPFLSNHDKNYQAELLFGKMTDTYDVWGETLAEQLPKAHSRTEIEEVLQSFCGPQLQLPPLYSAIKVNGKKLYQYARSRQAVEVKPRMIEIKTLELLETSQAGFSFSTQCSAGTYIRTLCVDLAAKMGELGVMSKLRRWASGKWHLAAADKQAAIATKEFKLLPIEDFLTDYPKVEYPHPRDVINGKVLNLDSQHPELMVYHQNKVLAYYRRRADGLYVCQRGLW